MNLPGVPSADTRAYEVFKTAFWPELYAGIISGIFTGLLVGIVIWKLQITSENRKKKSAYKEDIEMLRGNILRAFGATELLNFSSAIKSEPRKSAIIIKLLEGLPMNIWRQYIKTHPVLTLVEKFAHANMDFIVSASALDTRLANKLRLHNSAMGRDSSNDRDYFSYIIGRILGLADEIILAHINRNMSSINALHQAFESLSTNPQVQPLIEPFTTARDKLIVATNALKDLEN